MASAKTPKTPRKTTQTGVRKNTPAKDPRKSAESRKADEPRKATARGGGGKSGKAATPAAKYKTAAKRRPGRRKTARRGSLKLFLRSFLLVLVLGGGLLYALAPRGLDLLGLAATDSNVHAMDPATATSAPNGAAGNAYTSGQEPPTAAPANLLATPGSELDSPAKGQSQANAPAPPTPPPAPTLEDSIVRIDEILRQAMDQHQLDPGSLHLADVLPATANDTNFLFQVLTFAIPGEAAQQQALLGQFIAELADTLPKMRPPAAIAATAPGRWTIAVAGTPTHELIYQAEGAAPLAASQSLAAPSDPGIAPGAPGRLLIVIDDIGANLEAARELIALNFPVTLAVWPRSAHARACAKAAHAAGREVMIHQPMEPVSFPRDKPGPGAIFVNMSDAEIRAVIAANLNLVPHAVGLNNHMGSKATQNRRVITSVLNALRGQNLFVLDSVTHDHSLFYTLARQNGFPALKRDIFLDNVQNTASILRQLKTAAHLAAKRGWAIAIGHPYPQTIAALRAWQNSHPQNIRMITAQELLGQ